MLTLFFSYFFVPGTLCFVSQSAMNRRVDLWGTDANEFNPSRFLVTNKKNTNNNTNINKFETESEKYSLDLVQSMPKGIPNGHLYGFAPFGAGRRTCPGQRLAFVEMIIMLSGIINKFEIKLAVDYEEIVKSSDITLGPKLGLPIYCIERESMLQQQYNKDTKEMEWEMKTINSKL